MLLLLTAAAAVSAQQPPAHAPAAATVQARATIRILSGATVHLEDRNGASEAAERTTTIRTEGSVRTAKLLEFQ